MVIGETNSIFFPEKMSGLSCGQLICKDHIWNTIKHTPRQCIDMHREGLRLQEGLRALGT